MLTIEQVDAAIKQIEAAFPPDYRFAEPGPVAPMCLYAYAPGKPACIVGWIIWYTDSVLFERIAGDMAWNHASVGRLALRGVLAVEGGPDGPLIGALAAMQGVQDKCGTWAEAIISFRATLASRLAAV